MVQEDPSESEHLCRLFVGGLDYRTTDDSLKEYFEQFGETVYVAVIRDATTKLSRGFGFVTYAKSYMVDDAQKQRPHKVDGRTVDTKRAVPRDKLGRDSGMSRRPFMGGLKKDVDDGEMTEPEHMCRLFVGGLDYGTTDENLKEYFEQFGETVYVVVIKDPITKISRGFGFVTYSRSFMVDEAQKQKPHIIDGRTVDTKLAVPRDGLQKKDSDSSARKLFVGGLQEDIQENDLREGFSEFGEVVSVHFLSEKNEDKTRYAYVEFEDYDAVDKACIKKDVTIRNKIVQVKRAHSKTKSPYGNRKGDMGYGNDSSWGNSQSSNWSVNPGWGQSSYGGGPPNYSQGGNQGPWQGNPSNQGWSSGQGNQGWSSQPSNTNWGQGQQQGPTDFGNNYGQSYGGGPMRSQNYGQSNPSMPYSNSDSTYGTSGGGYNQSSGYGNQAGWQGGSSNQGGASNQGWGSQPTNFNPSSGGGWNQGQQGSTDFGNNYGQSYGGGPVRNQSYGQQNPSMPYNAGGQSQSAGGAMPQS